MVLSEERDSRIDSRKQQVKELQEEAFPLVGIAPLNAWIFVYRTCTWDGYRRFRILAACCRLRGAVLVSNRKLRQKTINHYPNTAPMWYSVRLLITLAQPPHSVTVSGISDSTNNFPDSSAAFRSE